MGEVEAVQPDCPRCAALEGQVRELQRQVAELTARLNQDSSNSSRPPSSDPPSAPQLPSKRPTGRRPGGQPGHAGRHRTLLPPERVDEVVRHLPPSCRGCGGPLPAEPGPHDPPPSRHQVAELPPVSAVVTEHQGHARACPRCGGVTRAAVPPAVRRHALGPRLSAAMGYLAGRCHDGRRVVAEVVADLLGVPVSLGTVSAREAETSAALAAAYAQARRSVRASGAKNVDETGWKQAGRRRWLWVAASRLTALFAVHPRRSWEGLKGVLGPRPREARGVVTSDRFPTYDGLAAAKRQVCWSHLKRDFTRWSQPGGHGGRAMAMGSDGRAVCRRVLGLWRDFRRRRIGRGALREKLRRLRARLRQVLRGGAKLADAPDKKAATFCRKVLALEPALWTFAERAGVEPTNNHAERCLRPAVLWRKNSFGCQSDRGCRFVERMLTVVTTLRLRGASVLDYLCRAVAAHRLGQPAPSLLV